MMSGKWSSTQIFISAKDTKIRKSTRANVLQLLRHDRVVAGQVEALALILTISLVLREEGEKRVGQLCVNKKKIHFSLTTNELYTANTPRMMRAGAGATFLQLRLQ